MCKLCGLKRLPPLNVLLSGCPKKGYLIAKKAKNVVVAKYEMNFFRAA